MRVLMQFLGGLADDLTGSCCLITVRQGSKESIILVDAGLVQSGNFSDALIRNQEILRYVRPDKINCVVLTHSHMDHAGRLPFLAKHGFAGRVFCTEATRDLLNVMLSDSAKIQVAEAGYSKSKAAKEASNKQRHKKPYRSLTYGNYDRFKLKTKKHRQATNSHYEPLYTLKDVELVDALVKYGGCPYRQWIRLAHNVSVKFYPSGHVIGGAVVLIKIKDGSKEKHLLFTGDLGRKDGIILPPPEYIDKEESVDYFITESTYGGKIHPTRDQEITKLLALITNAAKKKQRVIIPSFALERSQEIIYLLSYHMELGNIPRIPIYLDSPLAAKITSVFSEGWKSKMFSDQAKLKFNPFDPAENKHLKIIIHQEDSDALVTESGSYIVIAGSGMCDAGRVRAHLRANLSKADTLVFLVGYMAQNSLGRKLKDRLPIVRMNHQEIKVKAEIVEFDSFSAHADGEFLVEYATNTLTNNTCGNQKIFIVHGEAEGAQALKRDLSSSFSKEHLQTNIIIPKINDKEVVI